MNLAAALNARGGPGIVLATVSYEAGIINENFFAMLVLVAIVTSMAAGSWLGRVCARLPLREDASPPPWRTNSPGSTWPTAAPSVRRPDQTNLAAESGTRRRGCR